MVLLDAPHCGSPAPGGGGLPLLTAPPHFCPSPDLLHPVLSPLQRAWPPSLVAGLPVPSGPRPLRRPLFPLVPPTSPHCQVHHGHPVPIPPGSSSSGHSSAHAVEGLCSLQLRDGLLSCYPSSPASTPVLIPSCCPPIIRARRLRALTLEPLPFPVLTPPCPLASNSIGAGDSMFNFPPEPQP